MSTQQTIIKNRDYGLNQWKFEYILLISYVILDKLLLITFSPTTNSLWCLEKATPSSK